MNATEERMSEPEARTTKMTESEQLEEIETVTGRALWSCVSGSDRVRREECECGSEDLETSFRLFEQVTPYKTLNTGHDAYICNPSYFRDEIEV
jgi:hypothetical protein